MKKIIVEGKEITVRDEFEYFQPNIHRDGDCVIRALCKATGWSWKKAYCFAFVATIQEQFMPNYREGEKVFYNKLGWKWHSHNTRKKRPSVQEFAQTHPKGTYVLLLSGHHVCVQDGAYYDSWDSGKRKMYGYWQKPEDEVETKIPACLKYLPAIELEN